MANSNTIRIPERFDFGHHKQFSSEYQLLLDDKSIKQIILDFSRTTYLDSSALGMMVLLNKKASQVDITTIIRGASGTAKAILTIAKFDKIYRFE